MEREKREGENRLNHDTALLCVECKLITEIGMGDGDKLAGAGAERLTSEMGDAELGDNVVNVVLTGGDDCAGLKDGLDTADGAVLCGGSESNKALAALGLACAADVVNLAAGTGHVHSANAFCADLTVQVHTDAADEPFV